MPLSATQPSRLPLYTTRSSQQLHARSPFVWILRNLHYQRSLPVRALRGVRIDQSVRSNPLWKVVEKTVAFLEKDALGKERLIRRAGKVARLAHKVLPGSAMPTDTSKGLQRELNKGHCYGVSLAVIRQLLRTPKAPWRVIKRGVHMQDIVLLQLFLELQVKLQQQQRSRKQLMLLALAGTPAAEMRQYLSRKQIPSNLIREWKSGLLSTKWHQGRRVGLSLRKAVARCLGLSAMPSRHVFALLNQRRVGFQRLQAFLLNPSDTRPLLLSCFSSRVGDAGHAIVVDLKYCRFFDENAGFYTYTDRKQMTTRLIDHLEAFYPELLTGRIEVRSFAPNPGS